MVLYALCGVFVYSHFVEDPLIQSWEINTSCLSSYSVRQCLCDVINSVPWFKFKFMFESFCIFKPSLICHLLKNPRFLNASEPI
jgi:hypothetical protein